MEAGNLSSRDDSSCEPADPDNTLTDRLNTLLNSSGPGYVLRLCQNTKYLTQAPLLFAAPNQEISTQGYPTGDERAMIVVNGPVSNGQGHTTAVDGTCANCGGVILRNIQINGTRGGASSTNGGANIEMGGSNSNQVIEYVRTFDPRSWSCMHLTEGALSCNNATVQNNEVGPCGSSNFQQWADGISVSCANSTIRNNLINNPTDGGIVLFGAPGTRVENNTIWVETQTMLGGINMVDYLPWLGDYSDTIVTNNSIAGGFSTESATAGESKGTNSEDIVIKIGIAIGPRTWFGDQYGNNVSANGTVINNQFSGAFSYAMAISSAVNFTVQNNVLVGNTSFIGANGPNCTTTEVVPTPAAFVIDQSNTQNSQTQADFQAVSSGDGLTCVMPPAGGDFWPFGGNPGAGASSYTPPVSVPEPEATAGSSGGGKSSTGRKVGIALGVIFGLAAVALVALLLRRWAIKRSNERRLYNASRRSFMKHKERF
ncbi:hypothetical protein PLICRDRAFT_33470 [Plicaturopsis crispa FD-325 SS-3]|nr:hypothetical protein PLICRDRAFT_33470 [Plicaturopsis crispa FD-325 SS-3]